MNDDLTLGEYIRRLRRKGPQRKSLAALSEETGISYTHLSRIESDSTLPGAETVAKLAEALGGDLRLMLSMAQCLPQVILDRISAESPGPSLKRSTYQQAAGQREEETPVNAVVNYALEQGLSPEEAGEMETTLRMFCALKSDQRHYLVGLIKSLFHEGGEATG